MWRSEAICIFRNWLVRCRRRGHVAALHHNGRVHRWIQLWHSQLRSSKIGPALTVTSVLSLLPFFDWYRPDVPHRMAAIKQLEEAMPAELLQEDAEWFQAWKASGIDQEVFLPRYFRQLDLPGGERKCFTSASAAIAAYYKKIATQEEYERIRDEYGDTTSVFAHVQALTSLGLQVRFVDNADAEDVMEAIDAGIPVMVGWYHRGDMLRGEPPMCGSETCGHWSVIHGYQSRYSNDASWLMSDPLGLPDIERGTHNPALSGYRVSVRQAAFHQRWQVNGPRSGWAIFVEAE